MMLNKTIYMNIFIYLNLIDIFISKKIFKILKKYKNNIGWTELELFSRIDRTVNQSTNHTLEIYNNYVSEVPLLKSYEYQFEFE